MQQTAEERSTEVTQPAAEDSLILEGLKKISPQTRALFLGVLVFGLLAQGMGLLNKFSHHDDVAILFDMGTTVSSGRWMLQVLTVLEARFFGTGNTSLPLYNGMLSFLCIGTVGTLLIRMMGIRSRVYSGLMGGLMVSFPFVTALFAYMFTSHPYLIGLTMMTLSAYLICEKNPWWVKLFAIFLGGAGVGIYQAFLSVMVTAVLFYHIRDLAEGEGPCGKAVLQGLLHLLCLGGVMLVYMAGNRFFLYKYQVELSSYQGIDQMGQMTFQEVLRRLGRAYHEFVNPTRGVFGDMYPGTLHALYFLLLAAVGVLALRSLIRTFRRDRGRAAALALLYALVPLGVNLIYVMVEEEVHALMVYGRVMVFLLLIWQMDRLELSSARLTRGCALAASLLLGVMGVMYVRYDNQCYLKDALHQQEAISYYNTLITRIKSLPGYRPEMKVLYANVLDPAPEDPTVYNIDELDFIRINPYWHNSAEYLHCPTWETFMHVWCGTEFPWDWDPYLDSRPEVQAMPAYPADGSIRILDDFVVVKF